MTTNSYEAIVLAFDHMKVKGSILSWRDGAKLHVRAFPASPIGEKAKDQMKTILGSKLISETTFELEM